MILPSAVRRLLARVTPFVHSDGLPVLRPAVRTLRVLIVDDEESVRAALSSLLRAIGHDTRAARCGSDALAYLRREPFDIMLCDIRMAEMSGLELVPQAMRLDPDLGVLMLTGVNDMSTATDALSRGAMDYLVKPIELSDLQRAIGNAAQRRRVEIERRNAERLAQEEPRNRDTGFERRALST